MNMSKVVTFLKDVYPYVRNEVRKLEAEELARVDAYAKLHKIDSPYVDGDKPDVVSVNDARDRDQKVAESEAKAAKARAAETAATTEVQANLPATPASGPATSSASSLGEAQASADNAEKAAAAAQDAAKAAKAAKAANS